jgi:uncharacterized protein
MAGILDGFTNFQQQIGVGADGPLSSAQYLVNPLTRNPAALEARYRGSWLAAAGVEIVANDMTREGASIESDLTPEAIKLIEVRAAQLGLWAKIREGLLWGRLYGGCIVVALIKGQDVSQPLDVNSIGSFSPLQGFAVLDRWHLTVNPLDTVDDAGPYTGAPRFYQVGTHAPSLRGKKVHYSRVLFRFLGKPLPFRQSVAEQGWGVSELEVINDRLIAFDTATLGTAQLVHKAHIRTLKIKELRAALAQSGTSTATGRAGALQSHLHEIALTQGIEGVTVLDSEDSMEALSATAFGGLADILKEFSRQLCGGLQIPASKLFGSRDGGLGDNGSSEVRLYYDNIHQKQSSDLRDGLLRAYIMLINTLDIQLPGYLQVKFNPLWQIGETEKATIAQMNANTIIAVLDAGIMSQKTAMEEIRASSSITGFGTNLTADDVAGAENNLPELPESNNNASL